MVRTTLVLLSLFATVVPSLASTPGSVAQVGSHKRDDSSHVDLLKKRLDNSETESLEKRTASNRLSGYIELTKWPGGEFIGYLAESHKPQDYGFNWMPTKAKAVEVVLYTTKADAATKNFAIYAAKPINSKLPCIGVAIGKEFQGGPNGGLVSTSYSASHTYEKSTSRETLKGELTVWRMQPNGQLNIRWWNGASEMEAQGIYAVNLGNTKSNAYLTQWVAWTWDSVGMTHYYGWTDNIALTFVPA